MRVGVAAMLLVLHVRLLLRRRRTSAWVLDDATQHRTLQNKIIVIQQ
jgi:hypothetical protein